MRILAVFCFVCGACALPRIPRQEGAEVIRVVDEKTPITFGPETPESPQNNAIPVDLLVVDKEQVGGAVELEPISSSAATPPQQPTPVPENVAITTEKMEKPTPALVPSVVEISTANPNEVPPPPPALPGGLSNDTTTIAPDDDEDSEEDGDGSEEADEESGEEEDEEEDDDEEEEEDEEADDEDDKAKRIVVKRDVAGEEVPSSFKEGVKGEEEDVKQSDEEESATVGSVKDVKEHSILKPVGLQAVVGSVGTGEDDEAESSLQHVAGKPQSVVIASSDF